MVADREAIAGVVCRSYIDRVLSLLSANTTSFTRDSFVFSGENLFSAVSSTPFFGDSHQHSIADKVETAGKPAFIQFNITSTASGMDDIVCHMPAETNRIRLI